MLGSPRRLLVVFGSLGICEGCEGVVVLLARDLFASVLETIGSLGRSGG